MKKFIFLFFIAVLMQSCTIEKRLYTGGYHVSFRKSYRIQKATHVNKDELEDQQIREEENFESAISDFTYNENHENNTVSPTVEVPKDAVVEKTNYQTYPERRTSNEESRIEEKLAKTPVLKFSYHRKKDKQINQARMQSRSDVWDKLGDILFWAVLVGLVALGLIFPVVGKILLVLSLVLLVLLVLVILSFFAEIFDAIFELLS